MTTIAPVELPAFRTSRAYNLFADSRSKNQTLSPIHPSSPSSDVATPYFDAVPQFSQRINQRSEDATQEGAHKQRYRTADSPTLNELEAGPVFPIAALKGLGLPLPPSRRDSPSHSIDGDRSMYSGSASIGAPSTVGTQTMLEEQTYSIPQAVTMPKENLAPSPVILSVSTSMTSLNKRPAVPTSKFSRKPASNMSDSMSYTSPSLPQTPTDSPRLQTWSFGGQIPMQQLPEPPPIPEDPVSACSTPRLTHAKSTASERKARALHSHPSNPSLKDQPVSPVSIFPPPPIHKHRKSNDSRRSGGHDYSQPPSAAPQDPLPDLPPEARRPTTRDRMSMREKIATNPDRSPVRHQQYQTSPPQKPPEAHLPSPSTSASQSTQHKELAEFMLKKNTVIFRRFDDVHVRLLLSLQDDISNLEKELASLDSSSRSDADSQKVKVMGELRRLLAEYDHLFSNWKQMQAAPASAKLKDELSRHLRQSTSDPSSTTSNSSTTLRSAKDDLVWLEKSTDLSSVQIVNSTTSATEPNEKQDDGTAITETKEKEDESRPPKPPRKDRKGGGGGGFAALFSCGSRRK